MKRRALSPEIEARPRLGREFEGAFLHLCLRGRWDLMALERARALVAVGGFDWDVLDRMTRRENLVPLLYHILGGKNMLPPPLEQDWCQEYLGSGERHHQLSYELEGLLSGLSVRDIPVMLLRGAALAKAVYDEPVVRPMRDLDLLVRSQHVPAVLRALEGMGYARAESRGPYTDGTIVYQNDVQVSRPGRSEFPIWVHWSLFNSPYYQCTLPVDWFWETSLPLQIGRTQTWVLGPEAQTLYLCGHMLLHRGGAEYPWVLWTHDVAEVIVRYGERMDWELVLRRAQSCDLVLAVKRILGQVSEEWGVPISADVLARLRDLRPSRQEIQVFAWRAPRRRSALQRFWSDMAGLPGSRFRLRYLWHLLFPSWTYMRHRYQVSHALLLPLYYPYRWYRGLSGLVVGGEGARG
jgi:hypothetical protein